MENTHLNAEVPVKKRVGRPRKNTILTSPEERVLSDLESKLNKLPSWGKYSQIHKRIILFHIARPNASKPELAKLTGHSLNEIYEVFNSPDFTEITIELAKYETRELVQLAVQTVKDSLQSKSPTTRLNAARMVLNDVGIFVPNKETADRKVEVSWEGESQDSVQAASPATASS